MIFIWRTSKLLKIGLLISIPFLTGGWGTDTLAPGCSRGPEIKKNLATYLKDSKEIEVELHRQKGLVKASDAEKESKKFVMTTHLIVLAANLETAKNLYESEQKAYEYNQCSECKGVLQMSGKGKKGLDRKKTSVLPKN